MMTFIYTGYHMILVNKVEQTELLTNENNYLITY